jgi:hypothetical protein
MSIWRVSRLEALYSWTRGSVCNWRTTSASKSMSLLEFYPSGL